MKSPEIELEIQVQAAIGELYSNYKMLDELADVMLIKQANNQAITDDLQAIVRVKKEINSIDSRSLNLRNHYRDSRQHASNTVTELTRKAGELLASVMGKIEQLETKTHDAFDKLIPKVDANVRANQMKQAYGIRR